MATRLLSRSQSTRGRYTSVSAPVSIHFVSPPATGTTPTRTIGFASPACGKRVYSIAPTGELMSMIGIARHRPLVHFVVGDFRGIGRPPVGRGGVELFGIDPIELALENFLAAAGGERLASPVATFATHRLESRTKLTHLPSGENFGSDRFPARHRSQTHQRLRRHRFQIQQNKIAAAGKEQRVAGRRPDIVFRLDAAEARGLNRRSFFAAASLHSSTLAFTRTLRSPFAASIVHISARCLALEIRDALAVGTPLDSLGEEPLRLGPP